MSDIIQLLPDHIANQIAAGEVIQRPASVVKELMENAIDAGADSINLIIIDAGKTLVHVVDNGAGMTEQDAQTAFERHATSKLKSADDLFNLHTKGFRGEALASVAAIAHVTLKTKHTDANLGTRVTIEGSKTTVVEPDGIQKGSSLAVKNLFFNVPARRNFLKSDNIENKHIIEEFKRVALTHPDIAFSLHSNGNEIYNLNKVGNLRKRIVDIFGKSFNDKLVPIEEETDLVKISGFVVKPEFARKSSGEHYLFVNQRFFKDRYFYHAIKGAFENLIANNMQPSFFLYFEINPASIDVNVHPTKTEIKFEEDRAIYAIIRSVVRRSLGLHNIAPTLDFEQETSFPSTRPNSDDEIKIPQIKVNPDYNPFLNSSDKKTPLSRHKITPNRADWENFYQITEEKEIVQPNQIEFDLKPSKLNTPVERNLFQVFNQFILVHSEDKLLWIDQTQASMRVIYDELMQQFITQPINVQQLLFSIEKELQLEEKSFWETHAKQIERIGFRYEWQENTIHITGIPAFVKEAAIDTCVDDILHRLAYQDLDSGEFAHAIILSLAKGNAVKKGKELSEAEIESLISRLFASKELAYSPEGKKIIYSQSLDEILSHF